MPNCPRGHQSAATDYCDVCGRSMTAQPAAAPNGAAASPVPLEKPTAAQPAADPDPGNACPLCGTPRAGRFCEVDGYDFMTATLMEDEPSVPSTPTVAPSVASPVAQPPAPPAAPSPAPPVVPEQRSADNDGPATGVRVTADRGYFDIVRQAGGPDAGALAFPDFCPERRFQLRGSQVLIGRRSRSRGIDPDVDLTGPPEDPGVSHAHALLLPQANGGWAVVDLGSANGTYVNDPTKAIPVRAPIAVKPGDRIYAGAWTLLTVT